MATYKQAYEKRKLTLWVDLCTHCNAACPQCHRTDPSSGKTQDWLPIIRWSLAEFKLAFPPSTLQHSSNVDICGTWGDPIMNKDLFKICEYIIEVSDAKILINTNGSLRTTDWWWDLGVTCGNRLDVVFAIDGISQEQHETYRRNTDLQMVLDNMLSLSQTPARATAFTVLFAHNEEYIQELAKLSKRYGAERIAFVKSDRFKIYNSLNEVKSFSFFDYTHNNQHHTLYAATGDYEDGFEMDLSNDV